MYRLREAWIIKPITVMEARENGYLETSAAYSPDNPWLIEKWTNSEYRAWVNEQPVSRMMADGNWVEVSGANPYGFVPIVYIPHIRIDGFYGENMFDTVKGVIQEINLRMADFGDAISVDAHAYLGMRNISGSPKIVRLAPGINGISVGNTPGMAGPENRPDIWELRKASASDAMAKMIELLYDQFRRDAFIPKVADGEDEGSQRSGLTLAMRMLSLLWHVYSERIFWTSGLNLLNRMILRMLVIKEGASTGMTIRHAALRIKQDWSPVLPRDREMLVNEAVARAGAMISSPQTVFDLLGDIQDSDQEIAQIIEFVQKLSEARSTGNQQQPKAKSKKVAAGTPTGTEANTSEE
jgi:hypothetical protein